jgi:hypothetical protein
MLQYSSGNQSWTLEDFTFSLSGGTSGKVSVVKSGDLLTYTDGFAVEMGTGLSTTTNAHPDKSIQVPANSAFVCIELDMSLKGGISAQYTSGVYGVSGSASSNDTFTIAFYKKCRQTDLLRTALGAAFSDFVLPLHSRTLSSLKPGDYVHHNFNGNLQLGLGASIGLDKVLYAGQYKADIPDTASAMTINTKARPEIQAGAKLTFSFEYDGSFETLIWKETANSGRLHLYRSSTQDLSLGLPVGVTLISGLSGNVNVATDQLKSLLVGLLPAPLSAPFADGSMA